MNLMRLAKKNKVKVITGLQRRFYRWCDYFEIEMMVSPITPDGYNLAKKLREHDLTMLTLRKPGLIERRVNSATQKILTDLESSTATVN